MRGLGIHLLRGMFFTASGIKFGSVVAASIVADAFGGEKGVREFLWGDADAKKGDDVVKLSQHVAARVTARIVSAARRLREWDVKFILLVAVLILCAMSSDL
mmetsp:Transcript_18159/g.32897  ORF Transcript_18159/g.32897 Transcript_18159/m.32897 type:complete len:102 (-) Transcript_18159:128-433(-)